MPTGFRSTAQPAFTTVELLTCIGILSLLASFLMPVLTQSTQHARRASDQSSLRQIATAWLMYCQDHDDMAMPSPHPARETIPAGNGNLDSRTERVSAYASLSPYLRHHAPRDPAAGSLRPDPVWGTVHHAYNSVYVGGTHGRDLEWGAVHGWRQDPVALARIEVPWDTLVFCDSGRYAPTGEHLECTVETWPPSGAPRHPPTIHARHAGRANVAFADGHACSVTVHVPDGHSSAKRWRDANLGWLVRRGKFDDSLYNGRGTP